MFRLAAAITFLVLAWSARAQDEGKKDVGEYESKPALPSIPKDKFSKRPTVQNRAEPPWPDGVIDSGLAPFPAGFYKIENQWHQMLGGSHVKVYAGTAGDNPSQGLLIVQTTSADLSTASKPEIFKAPKRDGALRIVSAEKTLLTLESSGGSQYVFDALRRQLISK